MDNLNSQCLIQHTNDTSTFYGVRLNNYFSPSSCSNHKMYFGTLNDIKVFVENIGRSEQACMTKNAFKRYLSGESDATHEVAYIQQNLSPYIEDDTIHSRTPKRRDLALPLLPQSTQHFQ